MRPEDLVKGAVRLISPPEILTKITRMVDDPHCSGIAIARVIGEDPALTARLLRIANSSLYGFSTRIDTISRAIAVIGMRGLRDLVVASSAVDVFSRLKAKLIDMDQFWRQSLLCGINARLLGLYCKIEEAESLFVSGLLHDIGQLIILNKLPEMARETHLRAKDSGVHLHILERGVIGFDHAEVGGELLRQWLLPEHIWEPVLCHHAPGAARHNPVHAAIVHIANVIASDAGMITDAAQQQTTIAQHLIAGVDPIALSLTGLNSDSIVPMCAEALMQRDSLAETMLSKAA